MPSSLISSFGKLLGKSDEKLFGKLIVEYADADGIIKIFQTRKNKRILTFGTLYEQTSINVKYPHQLAHQYTRAMVLPCFFSAPQHCLVLGLGGGAIVQFVSHYFPKCQIDAVEIRSALITIARKHLQLPCGPKIRIFNQDAHGFIATQRSVSYDLILCDLYLPTGMDLRQATCHFIDKCRNLLSPTGWLCCNLILSDGLQYGLISQLLEKFSSIYICNFKVGNTIVLASLATHGLDMNSLAPIAETIGQTCGFNVQDYINKLIRFSV